MNVIRSNSSRSSSMAASGRRLTSNATLNFTGNSVGRPFYNKDLNNFGPGAGLAWDVFGNGKTAIRAGYGVNYVTDEAISVAEGFTSENPGLQTPSATVQLVRLHEYQPSVAAASGPFRCR